MRVETFTGIQTVTRDIWDCVSAGHPFAGWEWCLHGEQVLNAPGHYVVVWDAETPVGGACFYVLHSDELPIQNLWIYRIVRWYLQRHPMIVARTAYGTNFKGLFLPKDVNKQSEALQLILDAGKQITQTHRGSFLICDYLEDADLKHQWTDCILLPDFLDVGMHLDTGQYQDFDAYMRDLRQKKGKRPPKEIRRHTRKAQANGVRVEIRTDLPDSARALELVAHIDRKYNELGARPYSQAIIDSSTHLDQTQAQWIVASVDQKMVSCELILFDQSTGVCAPTLFGRDQSVDFTYFYTFYELIRYSIEGYRAQRLIGGPAKEQFKLRLGFELDYRNHFAVYISSFLNRMIAKFLIYVLSHQPSESSAVPAEVEDDEQVAE